MLSYASAGIAAMEASLKASLPGLLATTRDAAANASTAILKRQLIASIRVVPRAAAKGDVSIAGFKFDVANPEAVDWAGTHAGDLITGISETTREDIKDLVEEAMSGDFDVATLADEIAAAMGDDARAEVIARTESAKAAIEGQQELWDQAVEKGLLTGDEQQEWVVTDDDKLCPVCEPMDGVTVGLDESFEVDGDEIDGPPAHPNCRCTVALVVTPVSALEAAPEPEPRAAWFDKTTGEDDHGRGPKTNEKAQRAIKSFKPSTAAKQAHATKSEKQVSRMVGGNPTGDNAPTDVNVKLGGQQHGIEVKTFVDNSNDKVTMHGSSLERKLAFADKTGTVLHTVVFDKRNIAGNKRDYSGHDLYYRRGVGSFRLKGMTPVRDAAHLRRLMTAKGK